MNNIKFFIFYLTKLIEELLQKKKKIKNKRNANPCIFSSSKNMYDHNLICVNARANRKKILSSSRSLDHDHNVKCAREQSE